MNRRRDLLLVLVLLALAATATIWLLSSTKEDAAPTAAPPQPAAAAPVKGVRADGSSRRARRASESPAADAKPKGPPASLLVRVKGSSTGRGGLAPLDGAAVYVIDSDDADWRAVTAAAGSARFDELPAGETVVHVEVAGRKVWDQHVTLKAGEETAVEVIAIRAGTLRGIVRDPDGLPVDGAWVHVTSGDAHAGGYDAVTGDNGAFEIVDALCGVVLTVTAGAPGWADAEAVARVKVDGEPPVATCEVVLRRTASLVVRVVDPSGQPADATVFLDGPNSLVRRGRGEFVRERIAPGDHTVTAGCQDFPGAKRTFSVTPGEHAEVELRFEAGVAIEGIVVDANGSPVANASVIAGPVDQVDRAATLSLRAARMRTGSEFSAQSAADGTFRLERLAPGDYALTAATETLASDDFVSVRAPATGIRVVTAPLSRVTFRIVRDGAAGDVGSIAVCECAAGAAPNRAARVPRGLVTTRATSAGRPITLTGLSRDARALSICGDDYAPVVVAVTPVPGTTVDLGDVHVSEGLSLKGRVVGADGRPARGAQVSVTLGPWTRRTCVAGSDGTFVIEHLAPGPVVVRASLSEFMGVAVIDVARDTPRADVALHTAATLSGLVRDGRGALAVGAGVHVRHGFADVNDELGASEFVMTDGAGRFSMTVAAGRCLVSAGGAWVPADVAEGGEATVTLEKP